MDLALNGKVAVVTGASRGIGRAVALALAGEGTQVACIATSADRAQATATACTDLGVKSIAYGVDVSDSQAVHDLARTINEEFDGVDILVNNAGITRDGVFMRMKEDDWDRVMDVNLKGAFNFTHALTRGLLKRGGAGRIINMASVVGLAGNAGQANYAASKGGLVSMTKSLAKEFGSRGVTVNAIAPGFIETDMTGEVPESHREMMTSAIALGRAGTPDDVASGVVFLASAAGAYVTGQVLVIDGGMRL
ncbi:MAG: 3-oxoacyl-[acyl-carrier-protein] reductase [Planctomycetes bacterium]|nr:3-oxoacyl-[acyl-carrier-protein] reductase [Planctomycetota bacterium]